MGGPKGAAVLVLALALAVPGAGTLGGTPAVEVLVGTDGGVTWHVHIAGFGYDPTPLTIDAGDSVVWHNHDFVTHTATDSAGAWSTGNLGNGQSATLDFSEAATYAYTCDFHPLMSGDLDVAGGPNQAPTVAITAPAEGASVQGTVAIEGTASDPDGSVASVEVRIDGGAWEQATGTASWTFGWDTTPVPNGAHLIEARATDDLGLTSALAPRNITVNNPTNAAPSATITSPAEGATVQGTVTIEGTASDPDGSVASVEVRIDGGAWQQASGTASWTFGWDTTAVPDGAHTLEARATDDQGLTGAAVQRNVTVDNPTNAAPAAAFTAPAEGASVHGTVTIEGTAGDPEGALAKVEVRIDGGAWQQATGTTSWSLAWDTLAYADGAHTLEARATDDQGVESAIASRGVVVANPPAVAFASPAEGAEVRDTATIRGTASDPSPGGSVASVEARIDAGPFQAAAGTDAWSFDWDTLAYADGAHTVEARATDDAGNQASASRTLRVGNPPSVAIATPAEGAEVVGVVDVTGTAQDPGPAGTIASVEVRIDGGPFQAATGGTSWSFAWDSRTVADGPHTIEARSSDGALFSPLAARSVVVDNRHPDLVVSAIAPTGHLLDADINVTVANIGDEAADAFGVKLEYVGASGLKLIGTAAVPSLAIGASATVTMTWDTFGKVGNFTLIATVDAANAIEELREDNNVRQGHICVPGTLQLGCLLPRVELR